MLRIPPALICINASFSCVGLLIMAQQLTATGFSLSLLLDFAMANLVRSTT